MSSSSTAEVLRNIFGDEDVVVEDSDTHSSVNEDSNLPGNAINPSGNAANPSGNAVVDDETSSPEMILENGMEFSSVDALHLFYQEHARLKGFAVIRRTGNGKYGVMTCDRSRTSKVNKCSKKLDCKARLNYKVQIDGSCVVTSIFHDHTHDLDPAFSPLMPAHRQLTIQMKRQLEANDIAGLRPCKNVRICEVQCGGPQNLGCTVKDCRNYIEERRRLRLGEGDAEAIRKMFVRLQLEDPNFFYVMDIDSEGRLRNILWIHPRCRAAYQEFHDVVSFDTTYLVNRYQMPFASVVGINHHGHSILLGCALVSNEEADTFKWIFSNWLQAMGNVHPTAIITDQCESIRKAIREVMPNTIHRFCIWHILSKIPTKFGKVADYNNCSKEFKGIVYDSLNIDTFESSWATFLVKYRLENNMWLRELYRERQNWVPVYLHHTFWAGMMSTQRSESMHAYFDEYIHSRSTLKQFMEQYDAAVANKVQKEFQADYESKTKQIKCMTSFEWEKQFQKEYTNSMFGQVQQQIELMHYCHVVSETNDDEQDPGSVVNYVVLERRHLTNYYHKELTYTVEWRPNGGYIKCKCRKFEFKGILCCHIMTVLAKENITTVNERYLKDRWKKTVIRPHSRIFFQGGYPHMTDEYKKYQEVEKIFQQCMDITIGSAEKLSYAKERFIEIKEHLLKWDQAHGPSNARNNDRVDANGQPLLNPNVATPRGRPRENRHISTAEAVGRARRGRGRPPLSAAARARRVLNLRGGRSGMNLETSVDGSQGSVAF